MAEPDGSADASAAQPVEDADPAVTLAAWRARGEQGCDPVQFAFMEALAGRMASHHGAARHVLEHKLAALMQAYKVNTKQQGVPPQAAKRSPLAELADQLAARAPGPREALLPAHAAAKSIALPDVEVLDYFRATWSRLSADKRLTQVLATVPENAGPLNSHHLVHRALLLMRELSPEYLHRFLPYADSLMWLAQAQVQAQAGNAAVASEGPRPESGRKAPRSKGSNKKA